MQHLGLMRKNIRLSDISQKRKEHILHNSTHMIEQIHMVDCGCHALDESKNVE